MAQQAERQSVVLELQNTTEEKVAMAVARLADFPKHPFLITCSGDNRSLYGRSAWVIHPSRMEEEVTSSRQEWDGFADIDVYRIGEEQFVIGINSEKVPISLEEKRELISEELRRSWRDKINTFLQAFIQDSSSRLW